MENNAIREKDKLKFHTIFDEDLRREGVLDFETSEVPLKIMLDIVAACIVLHNICIVNNEVIEED